MKVLKFLGLTLLTIIVLYVIIALASSKDVVVSVTREVDEDPQTVFAAVNDFNQYSKWNAWFTMDPNVKTTITGSGTDIGDKWSWESEMQDVGVGHMIHEKAVPGKEIVNSMYFEAMDATSKDVWLFEPTEDGGTTITWKAEMEAPFIMRPFFGSLMESGLTPLFNQSLDSLQAHMENANWDGFKVTEMPPAKYIYIPEEIPVTEMESVFPKDMETLFGYLAKNNIEPAGAPMGIFYNWGETVNMEVAVPVANFDFKLPSNIMRGEMEGGKAATYVHVGSYESSEAAHYKMEDYLNAKGYEFKGPVVEIYLNDPEENAPEDLETEIVYFIK